jgi:AraC-like DNA-binding protein
VWSQALAESFHLVSRAIGGDTPTGELSSASLGPVDAYWLTGEPQLMCRTARAAREQSADRLAIVIPIDGFGIVTQDGNQMRLMPGQMTIYEAKRPLRALLDQPWTFALLAFERDALPLPAHVVQRSIRRVVNLDDGPGAVLADFAASAIRQGPAMRYTSGCIGEAGLHLIAGTLAASALPDAKATADAQRLRVIEYATTHLADPALSHDRIARALHMAPRTLHRLFENEPATVTEYIRLQRLEATRRDLADPRLRHRSIAAIAARWGFPSQAHFTRAFQARYAMTPSTARQRT